MGGQSTRLIETGICGGKGRRCRRAGGRYMVRVAVHAVLVKCDHDMRSDAPDVPDQLLRKNALVSFIEFAVVIVEKVDLSKAQDLRRFLQLALADFPQLRRPWILFRRPEPALLAAGRGDQVGLNALGGIFGEDASYAQRFVIRVGENAEES